MVRIALTGTPGTGKTTVAARAAERFGWRTVDVKAWAAQEGCIVGHDEADGSDVLDVEALAEAMPADEGAVVLYEGHLSHLLGVDVAWVLRCDPHVLRPRLEARGYGADKVRENLEAEALDVILQEALDEVSAVVQRDGTRRSPDEMLSAFVDERGEPLKTTDLEPVDWSHRLPL